MSDLSIEEHKQKWVECEEQKSSPRQRLRMISKEQKDHTKAIRAFMEASELSELDCGNGWSIVWQEKENVAFSEDVVVPYMDTASLERLKREQKKRKSVFKTVPPAKRVAEKKE
tara:strand:- start:2423 stop:2764 length:342 start_codon:yes stop_codon:yes gene_type:complete